MKTLLKTFLCLCLFTSCSPDPKTDEEKTLYTIGVMYGKQIQQLKLSDHELKLLIKGLKDTAKGEKPIVQIASYHQKVQQLFKNRLSKGMEKHKKAGNEFLENFVKKEGGIKTKSGLAYKIIKKGEGRFPKPTDVVEVHYHGTLIDGKVFDSSVDRNKTASFPLNRVIKGWTEGLQLINPGGKIKLVIPSHLAYGDRGSPPKIPGGSTLVFDVELFSIKDHNMKKNKETKKKKKR